MAYQVYDYYFKKAKQQKLLARSFFKLEEIDQKYKLFKPNQTVLDLGAAPGSWSQYISKVIGVKGKVFGIDLKPIEICLPNAVFAQEDILQADLNKLLLDNGFLELFDHVVSDMAPATTGIKCTDQARSYELCTTAYQIAKQVLKPKGCFVCKMFHNQDLDQYLQELKLSFQKVSCLRPKSTRKQSTEIFIIAQFFLK